MASNTKPKSKKKQKKAKFKSLKKGSLTSELKHVKEEPSLETMSVDDDAVGIYYEEGAYSDMTSQYPGVQKKRKKVETVYGESGKSSKKKSKKLKATSETCLSDLDSSLSGKQQDESVELKPCENMVADHEQRQAGRSKMGGRISITAMPVKRVLMIKPEKLKKGNFWSRDCVPSPDSWLPQEDAILCAVVHEYGPHWSLACETLYGMTAGGFYRGRYRHPVHCCERYRELIQRYVLSAPENHFSEKTSSAGSGKALLKVTEDNIQMLLNVAAEQPDHELLLQRHFTAVLSSVWRMTSRADRQQNLSSRNGFYFGGKFFNSFNQISWNSVKEPAKRMRFTTSAQSCKLLAAALHEFNSRPLDDAVSISNRIEDSPCISEQLEVTLEFGKEEGDLSIPLPPIINLTIPIKDPQNFRIKDVGEHNLKAVTNVAESRFRDAARACFEGSLGWASSAFPANDVKLRAASKPQSLGKHKLSVSDSKPPRSKLKKTSERGEMHNLSAEPALQPLSTVSSRDPNLRFDLTPAIIQDGWMNDRDSCSISFWDEELPGELASFKSIPHDYDADLISGLDDFSLLPEYTDIG